MPEKVEDVEDASFLDPLLILQGESNFAPWLHFLIGYLGPEYWPILRSDGGRTSHLDNTECPTVPELASRCEKTPPPRTHTQGLNVAGSSHAPLAHYSNEEEDKCSRALSYLRATLHDEARNLIQGIDCPSEAFRRIKLFYGKPRHQTMALRWSKWANLRYTPGESPSEFIRSFGERLQDVEEIGDILDHKLVFAQFVHAISKDGDYPEFITQMSPDLKDHNLMQGVCDAFIRHETSFYAAPAPASANLKPALRAKITQRVNNGFRYCPYHNRMVKHTPSECRLGQVLISKSRLDTTPMFESTLNRNRKRRRLEPYDNAKRNSPAFVSGS
ncbi:hypothetical protein F1880_001605 [Penicillium rolfsii]|nr:hypothetical protein F1880_001605 [Penicillium rolfsii]